MGPTMVSNNQVSFRKEETIFSSGSLEEDISNYFLSKKKVTFLIVYRDKKLYFITYYSFCTVLYTIENILSITSNKSSCE